MKSAKTILIIDDDAPTRLVLADLVRRAGEFHVVEAADGIEGSARARECLPDLVLLDVMMPGRNGYEVCRDLRADPQLAEVPIIVLSAAVQDRATLAALEAGADDFLAKPPNLAELRAKIATIARLNRFRALTQERERLRWVVDRSLEPLVITDAQGAVVFANQRAREVFGLPEGAGFDVVAAVERHFQAEPRGAWADLRTRGFRPGPPFAVMQPESEFLGARWFDVELQAGDAARGELLIKFTDQSSRVRRDLETWTFQHLIFHKIRTPLNGLGTVLDLVAESGALGADPNARSLLDLARESAARLEATLLDILRFHQVTFGRAGSVAGPELPLRDIIAAAVQEAELPALSLDSLGDFLASPEFSAALSSVLVEVFENYRKFSLARNGGLEVAIEQCDAGTQIRCFCAGSTPPPEVVAQLGRPYWQVERQFTGEVPGIGLGLATARALLRSRGGDLGFAATPERPGLATIVTIPAGHIREAQPAPVA